jgi:lipopolysaccharide export system protein LptC
LTVVSPINQPAAGGYVVTRRSDGARIFRRALRHSRRVRFIRLAIPVGLLAAAAAALFAARLHPLQILTGIPIDFSNLVVSGTKVTMQAPRIAGFSSDSRPYEVTARAAAQDISHPDTIELQGLRGKTEMPDKAVFELTADTGIYDSKAEILTLRQNIVLKSSSGFEVYLSEAVIDAHNSSVVSEKPVVVRLQQGTIKANRMEVSDAGETIRFGGGVNVTMTSNTQVMHLNGKMETP